ncbi:transcription antitermination factor NusB [Danxiaibacter flavus]|uniref:Transcription antitermination factor NusB n=1 Tax=Danxiaibacter flavus TaxID=3049108 RepID=A0ABV3ZIL0_9BACT|nr:transcription antitermination factor NusB [Chitinophagaceae bacterium DXS]
MISRRNIRVKVMQLIYSLESMDNSKADPVRTLQKQFDQSRQLFVYLLYFLTEVTRYAETDARVRASKNLPSYEDLHVNTKIAGNELLWRIRESGSFQKAVETEKPEAILDYDMVRKIYTELVASDLYKEYITVEGRDKNTERDIIKYIFTDLMLPNEDFISQVEELFNNWDDDADMMNQLILNYIHKPASFNLQDIVGDDKWKFARNLLTTSMERKEQLMELIVPKLKNWDSERIAILDMILMRMGVCEFLYFETIPPKVTINEYIDVAKEYSTPQSGQFVNGILDSIHKELLAQNKIQKIDFKQKI